jgi:hypothetical protein
MVRVILTTAIGTLLLSSSQQAQPHSPTTSERTTVENYVQEVFFQTHDSGSMTFRGACRYTQQGRVVYSDELANPPTGPFKNIDEAMAALSAVDTHVSWKRDAEGLIRVSDDRVIGDVLRVRLKRIHFKAVADATTAIEQVMAGPEVRDYLKRKHIDALVLRTTFVTAGTALPKLSDELRDVTAAQALDRIIRFFPGVWFYGECSCDSSRRVTLRASSVGWPTGVMAQSTVLR